MDWCTDKREDETKGKNSMNQVVALQDQNYFVADSHNSQVQLCSCMEQNNLV